MSVYSNLMRMCGDRGLIPGVVEEEAGVVPGTIAQCKSRELRADEVAKLAQYFGVPMDTICSAKDEEGVEFVRSLTYLTLSGKVSWVPDGGHYTYASEDGDITMEARGDSYVVRVLPNDGESAEYVAVPGMAALWTVVTQNKEYKTANDMVAGIIAMVSGE